MPLTLDQQIVLENDKKNLEIRTAKLTLDFTQLTKLIELIESIPNEIPKNDIDCANWWADNKLWGVLVEARESIKSEIMSDALESIARDRAAGR
ncbi:hypothetical protein [Pseudomonas atagonensis]|uniref:hypothetical protein n=1 Tax=Pseudomonas atagonensis TaxID=2609964 RepID=UPI0014091575|nr:hypothetical protein [Pseudomonas atagonensis]